MYAATDPQHVSIHHSTCRTNCFFAYGLKKIVALMSVWTDDLVFVPPFSGGDASIAALTIFGMLSLEPFSDGFEVSLMLIRRLVQVVQS